MPSKRPIPKSLRRTYSDPNIKSSFGPYYVGSILDDILLQSENRSVSRLIGKRFSEICYFLNQIDYIPEARARQRLIEIFIETTKIELETKIKENTGLVRSAWSHFVTLVHCVGKNRLNEVLRERHEEWLIKTAFDRKRQSEAAKRRNQLGRELSTVQEPKALHSKWQR